MIFDTHIHSKISADSQMEPEEAILAAQALGIGICFSEHVDYELPGSAIDYVSDVPFYLSEYENLKTPNVLTGLEIGMTDATCGINTRTAGDGRIDFVLGSVHAADGLDIAADFFGRGLPPGEYAASYLSYVARMVEKNDFFDSLAHIDYPCRYGLEYREMDYGAYKGYFDRIFELLLGKGKLMELNTSMLLQPGARESLYGILSGYREKGGRYVTLGSDAHGLKAIGRNLNTALGMIKDIGLTPVYYRDRMMSIS